MMSEMLENRFKTGVGIVATKISYLENPKTLRPIDINSRETKLIHLIDLSERIFPAS